MKAGCIRVTHPSAGRRQEYRSTPSDAPRLACVRPAASVYPEPGSNSPLLMLWFVLRLESNVVFGCFFCTPFPFCFFYSPKVLAFFRQAVLAISFFQGTLWCSASFLRGFFVTHTLLPKVMRLMGICPIAGAKVNRFFTDSKSFLLFFSANLLPINNLDPPTLLRLQR